MKTDNYETLKDGRICEMQRSIYTIESEGRRLGAQLKGSFYQEKKELPIIGDYVMFRDNPNGTSVIYDILPRRNVIKRPDQSGHAAGYVKTMKEQPLAANFDYVFILSSLNNNYNLNRITRYVTVSLQSDAKPVVILTKADLCSDSSKYIKEVKGISDLVDVYAISALTGAGMSQLEPYLKKGTTIVLIGSSGVGKSTLVNAIAGVELMKVSAIRESDSRGHHTTTHRELITFPSGVTMIDSPGIRELGMCDVTVGIETTFSDIDALIHKCRFSDCRHQTEPGCAVKSALESGELTYDRWELYCKLVQENNWETSILSRR